MADRHRRLALHQQSNAIGLPTILLAPTTVTFLALKLDMLVLEQLLHTVGAYKAGTPYRRAPGRRRCRGGSRRHPCRRRSFSSTRRTEDA